MTLCSSELAGQTAAFPWFQRVDESRLLVPDSFGTELDESAAADKAPDITLEGLDLLAAFTRILQSAGAYALNCCANDGRSVLEIVPARYIPGQPAVNILRPAGGDITATAGRIGAVAGQIEEDGSDLYTDVVVAGDAVKLELRTEYKRDGTGVGLERGWTQDDENAFRNHIKDHPDHPGTAQAFLEACWKYPRVFAAYQIPANFDYLEQTKYADFPRVAAPPPLLPDLLSMVSELAGGTRRRVFPHPVSVELKDDGGDYRVRTGLDGLEVDDDGTLWLAACREAELNEGGSGTWSGDLNDADNLKPRDLRLTLALQADHRLSAALGLSNSAKAGGALGGGGSAGRIASGFKRQYYADTGRAYREHLRRGSWPIPESVNGSAALPDAASEGGELLCDRAQAEAHAQRRLAETGQTRRTGRLLFPSAMLWKPGQAIGELANQGSSSGSYPLCGVVSRVIHTYAANTTEIELV